MWRNVCLLLWLSFVVAVHASEVDCTKRLDVISPEAWVTLRALDFDTLSITKLVNVVGLYVGNYAMPHIAWHAADSKTYLQGVSPCFDTGHGSGGPRELVELQRRGVKDIQFGSIGFIVILTSDGTIWTAGCNGSGNLGHHGTENRPALSQVMGLPPLKKIAVTSSNVIALAHNGEMYSWGGRYVLGYKSNEYQNPTPKKISLAQGGTIPKAIDVCCGSGHCVMVTEDSKAFSWGFKYYIGRPVPDEYTPGLVAGIPEDERISKVACGDSHTLAVTTTGRLFGWGGNDGGCIMNTEDCLPHATELYMGGKIVRDVAAGEYTSLVVTDSGDSYYFGTYWKRSWYSPQPTVDHAEFPRDILAIGQRYGPSDNENTFGAVRPGCK